MWRRPVLTLIVVLAIPTVLALPMRAQSKLGTPRTNPAKAFTQEQVSKMVQAGLGDDSGSTLVEQRGIDFTPSDDFLQNLKTAGASEAFINAVRAAKPPEPASAQTPINQVQVFALLTGGVPSHRVAVLVDERGLDFTPTDDYLAEVQLAGGQDELVRKLRTARVIKPHGSDPSAHELQDKVRAHAARGSKLFQQKQYLEAVGEYRAAVELDPQNADLHVALSRDLNAAGNTDAALDEARAALRISPENDLGHFSLGSALAQQGDLNRAMAEYREALRLDPDNELAHANIGVILGNAGDWDGAIAEYREGLRLDPNSDALHFNLASALGNKSDFDGEIAEARAALHLNPRNVDALVALGFALGREGDWDGDIAEERAALRLNPNSAFAHANLGTAL